MDGALLLGGADGAPPQDPPDAGAAEEVAVSSPVPGWDLAATFRPAGPAGTYDVDVSGHGAGGSGSVVTTFRWTTPVDGPAPVPQASIAVLDQTAGQVRGRGDLAARRAVQP